MKINNKFEIGQEVRHFTGGSGLVTAIKVHEHGGLEYDFTHLNFEGQIACVCVSECELSSCEIGRIGFNGKKGD